MSPIIISRNAVHGDGGCRTTPPGSGWACGLIVLIAALVLPFLNLNAQITITREDDRSFFELEITRTYTAYSVHDTMIPLTLGGAGHLYDLSRYCLNPRNDTVKILIEPVSLPFGYATHSVILGSPIVSWWWPVVELYALTEAGRYYLGFQDTDPYHPPLRLFDPPRPRYVFPMTIGTRWEHGNETTHFYQRFGIDTSYASDYSDTAIVEASGILRLPDAEYECLRIKRTTIQFGARKILHELVTKDEVRVFILVDTTEEYSRNPDMTIRIVRSPGTTGTADVNPLPATVSLRQNYPNPFGASSSSGSSVTTLEYEIEESGTVSIGIHDLLGRNIGEPEHQFRPPGRYRVTFDGAHLTSGVYLVRLRVLTDRRMDVRSRTILMLK